MVFKSPRDVNTAVMELLIMAYALKTSCARNIIGVIPYFPYSKQSKMRKRGSIVCKLLASMLAKAGECCRDQQHGRLGCWSVSSCWASQRASVLPFFSRLIGDMLLSPWATLGELIFFNLILFLCNLHLGKWPRSVILKYSVSLVLWLTACLFLIMSLELFALTCLCLFYHMA